MKKCYFLFALLLSAFIANATTIYVLKDGALAESGYVYAWTNDANETPLLGAWPGTSLTEFETAVDGRTYWKIDVNATSESFNIIFNDNNVNQTGDITGLLSSVSSYWYSVAADFNYSQISEPSAEVKTYTIYALKDGALAEGGYLYCYGGAEALGGWPGTELSQTIVADDGFTYWKQDITLSGALNIIFNNGAGGEGNQTADITVLTESSWYAVKGDFNYNTFATPTVKINLTKGSTLYFAPNTNWTSDEARFAAYFYGYGLEMNAWVDCVKTNVEGVYEVKVPDGGIWTNVIFCRMDPATSTNSWDVKWNQTNDLTYDGTNNLYTLANDAWDNGAGSWSVADDELTGIEETMVDTNTTVEYYNLQGVKVANPENGIFIKKQGSKATKVIL